METRVCRLLFRASAFLTSVWQHLFASSCYFIYERLISGKVGDCWIIMSRWTSPFAEKKKKDWKWWIDEFPISKRPTESKFACTAMRWKMIKIWLSYTYAAPSDPAWRWSQFHIWASDWQNSTSPTVSFCKTYIFSISNQSNVQGIVGSDVPSRPGSTVFRAYLTSIKYAINLSGYLELAYPIGG